jgi:hypothetical protein
MPNLEYHCTRAAAVACQTLNPAQNDQLQWQGSTLRIPEVMYQGQNLFKGLVARLAPFLNIKKAVMKNLVCCSSMYCFSQRSRDKWLVIDSAMKATVVEKFDILFE